MMVVVMVVVVAFSSLARIWENVRRHYSPPAFFYFFKKFVIKVDISSRALIPLFMLGSVHSGSAT